MFTISCGIVSRQMRAAHLCFIQLRNDLPIDYCCYCVARFSFVTGHYSQVIWADTNRVGCGFTSYRENGTLETNLYVCNYGPAGNFIGLPSYKVGAPCSQCPANTVCSGRFASLCGNTASPANNIVRVMLCVCFM